MKSIFFSILFLSGLNCFAQTEEKSVNNSGGTIIAHSMGNSKEVYNSGGVIIVRSMGNYARILSSGGVVFAHSMGNAMVQSAGGVVIAHSMGNSVYIVDNNSGEVLESLPIPINLQIGEEVIYEKVN